MKIIKEILLNIVIYMLCAFIIVGFYDVIGCLHKEFLIGNHVMLLYGIVVFIRIYTKITAVKQ